MYVSLSMFLNYRCWFSSSAAGGVKEVNDSRMDVTLMDDDGNMSHDKKIHVVNSGAQSHYCLHHVTSNITQSEKYTLNLEVFD